MCGEPSKIEDPKMLPLNLALDAFSHDCIFSEWNPRKSIYKLLYIFCLKQLEEPLDTIKLLAHMPTLDKTLSVVLRCVDGGQVVQVAALLLVAWDVLVPNNDIENSFIGQCILSMTARVSDLQDNASTLEHEIPALEHTKECLETMWKMLEALRSTSDVVESYRKCWAKHVPEYYVPLDVAYLIYVRTKHVLDVRDILCDDISCFREKLKPEQQAKLNRAIEARINSGATLCTSWPSWGQYNGHAEQKRTIATAALPQISPTRTNHVGIRPSFSKSVPTIRALLSLAVKRRVM